MKTAAALKPSDLPYILARLSRETGATEAEARAAYEKAGNNYNRAKENLLTERRRQADAEAERQAEWRYQQQILQLHYWVHIRPAIRKWMENPAADPLFDDGCAFRLYREIVDNGGTAYQEKDGEFYVWHIALHNKNGWKSGKGQSDVSREALVLAWWQAFGDKNTKGAT